MSQLPLIKKLPAAKQQKVALVNMETQASHWRSALHKQKESICNYLEASWMQMWNMEKGYIKNFQKNFSKKVISLEVNKFEENNIKE